MKAKNKSEAIKGIIERLDSLELRLSRIESVTYQKPSHLNESDEIKMQEHFDDNSDDNQIESKVGETGLAWIGNFVLFFGITFLMQYIQNSGHHLTSSILGFLSSALVFTVAYYFKRNYANMASLFNLNAWLLLFYVALRLHFFTEEPLISNKAIGLLPVSLVTLAYLYSSIIAGSFFLTSVALILLSIIAVVGDSTHLTLSISVVIAVISILCLYYFKWIRLFYIVIPLVYLINLIWFLNNPFMSHQMQVIAHNDHGFIYLFIICVVFSTICLFKESEAISKNSVIGAIILNGIGFSVLMTLYGFSFFANNYVPMVGSVSIFCLFYAILLKQLTDWKLPAALYSLYGFLTLSLALQGIYHFPNVYFLLAIQSFLVVSMAIWFRSKFIVLMNIILFVILLGFYLSSPKLIDGVNISFSLVALLTARILNWQKDRLTIKTLYLRNSYLIIGFIMILITLHHLVPQKFVALSWTCAAVFYFIMSLLLKSIKYRYMLLGTIFAAVIHLFIVDLARIELVFRILALMFLAIISIGLSIYYSKKIKKRV